MAIASGAYGHVRSFNMAARAPDFAQTLRNWLWLGLTPRLAGLHAGRGEDPRQTSSTPPQPGCLAEAKGSRPRMPIRLSAAAAGLAGEG